MVDDIKFWATRWSWARQNFRNMRRHYLGVADLAMSNYTQLLVAEFSYLFDKKKARQV